MPIYEYQCRACDHRLEVLQKMSDDPLTRCPSCGEEQLSKLISAAAFRLSGSGWYETDFKKGAKKNLAGDKSAGGDKPAESATTKSAQTDKPAKSDNAPTSS